MGLPVRHLRLPCEVCEILGLTLLGALFGAFIFLIMNGALP